MRLTKEQKDIIDAICDPQISLVKVSAVSGAGKTATLIEGSKEYNPRNGLYLAFNKAIATEASWKFPKNIDCRTVHSLAHRNIVGKSGREVDFLTYKCIEEDISFKDKVVVLDAIEEFCNSRFIGTDYFNRFPTEIAEICKKYIHKMAMMEIPSTFGFLLKYFHLQLAQGTIKLPKYDLIMLDEAGDTTGVILEIFLLLKADKKVMVGDPDQNIYTFMNTINGFKELENEGVLLPLSQSFRVNNEIAKRVEKFVRSSLNANMVFKGVDTDSKVKNLAYISRTNASMIDRMVELINEKVKFSLMRDPKEIFSLPLALINLKPDKPVFDKRYRYLQDELIKYQKSKDLRKDFKTFRKYLLAALDSDIPLMAAIRLLDKHSYKIVYDTYNEVKDMYNKSKKVKHPIILTTSHTSKGLEWDAVYIEEDTNKTITRIMENGVKTEEELTELRLAYVACTRAKKELHNAKFLPIIRE